MASITLTGTPAETYAALPAVGSKAPDFVLVKTDLSDARLSDFAGKKLVLNIFLSVDTDTCPLAMRRFNAELENRENVAVLCVSADLPFALGRFLGGENLDRIIGASCFRDSRFGEDYGVVMVNGPLKGMLARAVVVIDEQGVVIHNQLVPEINDEPDYEAVLTALG